jgi:hypothetical protein
MSVAAKLGLPEAFQTTLLWIAVVLTLAPYFAGTTVGSLQIPRLDPRKRRRLRVGGPLLLLASVAVVLPLPILGPRPIDLHLIAADVTEAGDIDVAIQNAGVNSVLLTAVELEVIDDRGLIGRPVLPAGAAYRVPIDALAIGERRRVPIRFLVPAGAIERIVITPMTGRALLVRLRIFVDNKVELTSMIELGPSLRVGRGD